MRGWVLFSTFAIAAVLLLAASQVKFRHSHSTVALDSLAYAAPSSFLELQPLVISQGSRSIQPDDKRAAPTPVQAPPSLGLEGCSRVFIDGGANEGESIDAFLDGGFFGCAMTAPHRCYNQAWPKLTHLEQEALMQPLKQPSTFCIRSFEAAPELLQPLRVKEADLRRKGMNVRFVDGTLGNVSAATATKTLVRYSKHPLGVSAVSLDFADVHIEGPSALSSRVALGPSYSLTDVVREARAWNSSAVIAIKLDIEGAEYWALEDLISQTDLLCSISYIFIEFHGSATDSQRAKLPKYGLKTDIFEDLKKRAHLAMERPGCALKIYWRSFWASCGDKQRFEWRDTAQAKEGATPSKL